ncbi:MAG: hypothetical protein QME21_06660 [Anaerolineales bacterium]|nr:hypothetical protein [Anaerolineales bacterium]
MRSIQSYLRREAVAVELTPAVNWRTAVLALVLFGLFMGAMALVQFSTPDMPDNDGFYHIRLAQIMRTQGLKPNFPWLPLTILNPREFYDHHFLFHVGLIPFTFGDLRLGAKWASVVFASLAFLSIWWLLRGQRVPYSWLWALGLLAVSQAFLYRMSITRVQSLSLAVLAWGLHWMLTGKYARLLPLAFLYVWLYNAFPLLPITAVLYSVAVWIAEEKIELRPLIYASIGVAAGLLINPYFPVNLVFIYRHLLPKLAETTAVQVGNEWYPYTTRQLLENSPLALLAFIGGVAALGLNNRRMDVRTATGFLLATLFGLMLFQSRRFIEYLPPFALIFAAFAWAPLISQASPTVGTLQDQMRRAAPALILGGLIALGAWLMLPAAAESVQGSKPYDLYAKASAWLVENTLPGERIFHTDWDDFPRLFYYDTQNTYIVGLDPTYLQLYNPELYDLWVEITQGNIDQPSQAILERFGSRYVHSDLLHEDFIRQAEDDPAMQEVYRDDQAVIYLISSPQ